VALALPLTLATPAAAAGSTVTRYGSSLAFTALSGAQNGVTVDVVGGVLRITDTSGILVGPGCRAVSATTVTCGTAAGLTNFTAVLRDRADSLAFTTPLTAALTLDAGTGGDTVAGSNGSDTILLRDGTVDTVTCGAGNDLVVADTVDAVAANCERVIRS
jgi:Ca2+-binding RTX toxin-like protein